MSAEETCARGCCTGPNAQRDHYRSLVMGAPSETSQKQKAYDESLWEDRHAYKRLQANGLQPGRLKGSAELEAKATTAFEVESARLIPDEKFAARVDQAVREVNAATPKIDQFTRDVA